MKINEKIYSQMDPECVDICRAINSIPSLQTQECCCGHGNDLFRIWFRPINNLDMLPILLYYCDPCHVGFRWNCLVTTDCAMSPVRFRLESEVMGDQAYKQAEVIARELHDYIQEAWNGKKKKEGPE